MPAEFNYFPFDAGEGSETLESRWVLMMQYMRTSGVISDNVPLDTSTDDLAVTASSPGLAVDVAIGEAFLLGTFWSHTGDPATLTIQDNSSGDDRIDLVVVEVDFDTNITQYVVVEGTPAMSPVAPTPTQNFTIYQIPLAEVLVEDGAMSISSMDITDRRYRSVQGSGGSLSSSPQCYIYKNATTTGLTDASTTTISFDTAILNPDSMWENVTNPDRITISTDGVYYLRASSGWVGVALANGPVEIQIVLNGTTTIARERILLVGDDTLYLNADVFYSLSSADYLELDVINDSGQTLSLSSGADGPSLQAIQIST